MLTRLAYFLTGVITAMLTFLVIDHSLPVVVAVPVFIASIICLICCDRN